MSVPSGPAANGGKNLPAARDRLLFTPGPLTISSSVKLAMLRDVGSRDREFIDVVADVRDRLLRIAGLDAAEYAAILLPGSGTYGVEAVVGSVLPPDGRLLVIENGAYGRRMSRIADALLIDASALGYPENAIPDLAEIERSLEAEPRPTHLAMVHCETTTGLINPIADVGELARAHRIPFIVDAMSSFGGMPLDVAGCGIDFLISSANKCIEGAPGLSFVLARREALEACEGWARSLSLDLLAQLRGLDGDGQFRFTPPTHAVLALRQALVELANEGGVGARNARLTALQAQLVEGMRSLGFEPFLADELQGPVITAFWYPWPGFPFDRFYGLLRDAGYVIYPGKVSHADLFRIGTVGRLFTADVSALLSAVERAVREVGNGHEAALLSSARCNDARSITRKAQ